MGIIFSIGLEVEPSGPPEIILSIGSEVEPPRQPKIIFSTGSKVELPRQPEILDSMSKSGVNKMGLHRDTGWTPALHDGVCESRHAQIYKGKQPPHLGSILVVKF